MLFNSIVDQDIQNVIEEVRMSSHPFAADSSSSISSQTGKASTKAATTVMAWKPKEVRGTTSTGVDIFDVTYIGQGSLGLSLGPFRLQYKTASGLQTMTCTVVMAITESTIATAAVRAGEKRVQVGDLVMSVNGSRLLLTGEDTNGKCTRLVQ